MPHVWEGNRRSGVALAMRHGLLSDLSTYRLKGLRKGDEHPAYAPLGYGTFTFTLQPKHEICVTRCGFWGAKML